MCKFAGFLAETFPALAEDSHAQLLRRFVEPQVQAAIVRVCKYYRGIAKKKLPMSATSASFSASGKERRIGNTVSIEDDDMNDDMIDNMDEDFDDDV